jgi:predicted Fe-S protein YdhL (DUF1289 family)
MMSYKDQLKQATAAYMGALIKDARARWRAAPESERQRVIRRLEDGCALAAAEERAAQKAREAGAQ